MTPPYFCVGIYAEGSTDERFLCKLVDRLVHPLAYDVCPGNFYLGETRAIVEPKHKRHEDRSARIAAAIEDHWDTCNVFVIHADADGDPERAFSERIRPAVERARLSRPDIAVAPCIPVRTIEAWMLADADAFRKIFERSLPRPLPGDPQTLPNPKAVLEDAFHLMGIPPGRDFEGYDALLGEYVRVDALQRLSAFQQFMTNLRSAMIQLAHSISHAHP